MTTHSTSLLVMLLAAALGCAGASAPPVRPGLDVLLDDSLHRTTGRRVGLLANHASVDAGGRPALDRLRAAGVRVTALFSPEHGWRGTLDTENIGHGIDSATGLPVFSLYGDVREPTPAMLAGVDLVLVDLPDIGARTFTYVSTALGMVTAAARAGIPVLVLDRPNPIGGVLVQGPPRDAGAASFVGLLPVPLRHGLTMGELVRLGAPPDAPLTVIPAAGWRRAQWFDATGLPWVRPSPSMPSLESAAHYPGLVLFEATALSVGRGTPLAFQVLGAPWLDAAGLARALAGQAGLAVRDTSITPTAPPDGKHGGERLPAVRLAVTDRAIYDPTAAAVHALVWLLARHPDELALVPGRFDRLAGGPALREALTAGVAPEAIIASWGPALDAFRQRRGGILLY